MKKIFIIIGVLIVGLVIAGVIAVNTLASVPPKVIPQAEISKVNGDVQYKSSSGQWQEAKLGTVLSTGDSIKTGNGGSAELSFYDNARASLAEKTEVEMKTLYIDQYNNNHTNVNFSLKVGRVWNRIISLVDENASYEVETSNTVSTVRGTIFDIAVDENGKEEINAVEHDIQVAVKNNPELKQIVSEKKRALIDPEKIIKHESPFAIQDTPPDFVKGNWFTDNDKRDHEFDTEIKKKIELQQEQAIGVQPGEPLYGLKRAAEQVRLATEFNPQEKEHIQEAFEQRRIAEAAHIIRQGDEQQGFARIQDVMNGNNGQPLPPEIKNNIQNILRERIIDQKDGIPQQDMQRFQEQKILRPEAGALMKTFIETKPAVIQPNQNPINPPQNPDGTKPPLPPINGDLRQPLPINTQPTTTGPVPIPNQPMVNQPILNPLPPTTVNPISPIKPLRIEIKAPRTSLSAGESVGLHAGYIMSDGSIQPAGQCQWSMSGDPIGHVGPDGFLSTQKPGGVATIHANCMRDGQTFSDTIEITALDLDGAIVPFQP